MTTITQKKKMSKSAWLLIFLAIAAVIAVIITASLGIIDLSPVSNVYLAVFSWAGVDIVNAILLSLGLFMFGVLVYYAITKYIIGNKVTTTLPAYTPTGQTVTPQKDQGTETVIS